MEKPLKDKWVKALRSGNYLQGSGALCRVQYYGAEYCCLGVLIEESEGEDAWEAPYTVLDLEHDERSGMPSYAFLDKVGLPRSTAIKVAEMNDKGDTFDEIATWIEGAV